MSHRYRWTIRLLLGLALAALAGCGASLADPDVKEAVQRVSSGMEQQARAVQKTQDVGTTLKLPTGEQLTVERVGTALEGVSAPEGRRLVVVELALVNAGAGPSRIDLEETFWMSDITGRRYLPIEARGLPAGELLAGQQAQATLAFAVFPDAQDLRFYWQAYPLTAFVIDA